MNPEAVDYLKQILTKNPRDLTPDEGAFLRARSSYLKDSELKEYESVLNQTSKKETVKKKNGKS